MNSAKPIKVALIGNPNSGKSSLFNYLTGLNQKVGNFPGVTVDKKVGRAQLPGIGETEIIDLPGIYSIYPRSIDERIVAESLLDQNSPTAPTKVVVVVDATNIKRGLLLLTQIVDIGLPTVLALNMMDLAAKAGVSYDFLMLSQKLGVTVVPINARKGEGIDALKKEIVRAEVSHMQPIFPVWAEAKAAVKQLREAFQLSNDYQAYQFLEQPQSLHFLSKDKQNLVESVRKANQYFPGKFQGAETIQRYGFIQDLLNEAILKQPRLHLEKFFS